MLYAADIKFCFLYIPLPVSLCLWQHRVQCMAGQFHQKTAEVYKLFDLTSGRIQLCRLKLLAGGGFRHDHVTQNVPEVETPLKL